MLIEIKNAFAKGRDAKNAEIREMGFVAARDKFNMDYPRGEKWSGSLPGYHYAKGELQSLLDHL